MPYTSLGNGGAVGLICASDVGTHASSKWTCLRPVLVGVCIVGWFCCGRVVCDRSWLVGVCSVHGDGCDCSVIITGDTDTASSVSLRVQQRSFIVMFDRVLLSYKNPKKITPISKPNQ